MGRQARQKSSKGLYHCIIRGVDKQNIFNDNIDRKKFIKILKEVKNKHDFNLIAYCLMSNHVHIIIEDYNNILDKIMKSIEVSYSYYYNQKYERTGHFFENRYLSKNIEDDGYLLRAVRYVHQNPEKSGIGKTENYRWSSYKEYIYSTEIINSNLVLQVLNDDLKKAKEMFSKYNLENKKPSYTGDYVEFEMVNRLTDNQAQIIIKNTINIDNINNIKKYNIHIRDEYLRKIKKIKGITDVQISRITGISKYIIEKLIM